MKALIIIFFLFPALFFGQGSSSNKNVFNILLTAGVTPAQVHGDAYSGFKKLGATGGVGIESVFSEKASMSLSFLFIQKGAQKNQNLTKGDLTAYFLNLNYLEVPILVTTNNTRHDGTTQAGCNTGLKNGSPQSPPIHTQ